MKKYLAFLNLLLLVIFVNQVKSQHNPLKNLSSPIIFKGNDSTAYRDPAVLYENNQFYLFFTLVKTVEGKIYSYTATSHSKDLKKWSDVKVITPKDQSLDYCSPGNIVRYNDEWVMCLQTYPRPDYTANQPVRYGNGDCRLFLMRSNDLVNWGVPEIIKVKGPDVKVSDMGRMIDPYLLEDKDEKGKWWCFYKQNGVSMSYSYDLSNWTYFGHTESGENVTVLNENNEYILIHSPSNGIAIKRSPDLKNWKDWGKLITLGQDMWEWAKGRITAGTVMNLMNNNQFGKYIMFFHGSGPKTEQQGDFDRNASIGIAWSDDLVVWEWPGKTK
jgi:hypothetical protein